VGIKEVIKSQYYASLEMLRQAVIKCPDSLWCDGEHANEFWHNSIGCLLASWSFSSTTFGTYSSTQGSFVSG